MLYFAVFIIFIVAMVIINNAMMMATLQRTPEMGTMRAIGAQRGFVLGHGADRDAVPRARLRRRWAAAGRRRGDCARPRSGIPAATTSSTSSSPARGLYPSAQSRCNIVAALVIVLMVTALSTLYPAIMATRVSPVRAMQTDE